MDLDLIFHNHIQTTFPFVSIISLTSLSGNLQLNIIVDLNLSSIFSHNTSSLNLPIKLL